jgi:hypothetical protein
VAIRFSWTGAPGWLHHRQLCCIWFITKALADLSRAMRTPPEALSNRNYSLFDAHRRSRKTYSFASLGSRSSLKALIPENSIDTSRLVQKEFS